MICLALAVFASAYNAWQNRGESRRTGDNHDPLTRIKVIHGQSRQTYGSQRITAVLRAEGLVCNEKRIARLMWEHGIKSMTRRKFWVTTNSRHRYPVAMNVLNRQFIVTAANHVWVSDITYLWTNEGWLYLGRMPGPLLTSDCRLGAERSDR